MININSLKFLSDKQTLYIMIAVSSFILLIAVYFIGYYNQPDHDQLCLEIRQDRDKIQERMITVENQKLEEVLLIEERIKSVQSQICRKQLNKFKAEYRALRCEICETQQ